MKKISIIAILIVGLLSITIVTALPNSYENNDNLQLKTPDEPRSLNQSTIICGCILNKKDGTGIANATFILWSSGFKEIICTSPLWKSDENGYYSLDLGMDHPGGDYKALVWRRGYWPTFVKNVHIVGASVNQVDFYLKKIAR